MTTVDPLLQPVVRALQALSPQSRELVSLVVRQLANQEGVNFPLSPAQGLQSPEEGVPLWLAKLRQEGYSRRTVELYLGSVRHYLRLNPVPTCLDIQQWLASRLDHLSAARVNNDRKALRSFFGFLYEAGLWHFDPTAKLRTIKVPHTTRDLPETTDIARLLQYDCHQRSRTDKFRTMLLLLVTTGLRMSEAASILKRNIDFKRAEVKVMGKGSKEGMVPLLPVTASALKAYMEAHPNGSPFLFPGDTELGHWSISNFEKMLRTACAKLGVKGVTPHQLRHYFATEMLRGGAKLEVVSRIIRHAGVGVTADIYRHVRTQELHEEAMRFAPFNTPALP